MYICLLLLVPSIFALIPSYLAPGTQPNQYQQMHLPPHLRLQKHPSLRGTTMGDSLDAGLVHSYLSSPHMDQEVSEDGSCESMPNKTRHRPAFYQCSDDTPFTLHGGAVTNITGDDRYPVSFREPIRVFLDITSDVRRRFDNLGVEVSLYKRSSGWFGCGWMFLPSFGMLSNPDMCYDNPSCPVSPGRQVVEFAIDPSRLFTRLFRMIHHDLSAYQLVIRLRDNSDPYDDLLCATIQMRIQL